MFQILTLFILPFSFTNSTSYTGNGYTKDEKQTINSLSLNKYTYEYTADGDKKWILADRDFVNYTGDGYRYIYTDSQGFIRKLILHYISEENSLLLVGYYDRNGDLIEINAFLNSVYSDYFKINDIMISGYMYDDGERYSDFKYSYLKEGENIELIIIDQYPEIKFPFLGEVDLTPYLNTLSLKEYFDFYPGVYSINNLHYKFTTPHQNEYSCINRNNVPLKENPDNKSPTHGVLDVGHPVDIIDIIYVNEYKWFKVQSQYDKNLSGFIMEEFLEPVERIVD